MKHKLMIYIPLLFFISATLVLAFAVLRQKTENKIELPIFLLEPTPTIENIVTLQPTLVITPTPIDPSIQIKKDLDRILQDIGKVKVEDTRFKPPVFEFDMGI